MKRPIIGITSGEVRNAKLLWAPYVYGQSHTYVNAVEKAGGVPIIFPIVSDKKMAETYANMVDGVLFAGGNDIEPRHYGQEVTHAKDMSTARDEFEIALFQEMINLDKPILGICRGMQLMNVVYGGSLYQDVLADLPDALNHEDSLKAENFESIAHTIYIEKDSKLAKIIGDEKLETNSLHHQSVDRLGEGLVISARSSDGVVEAIEDPNRHFVTGVQSHPEAIFETGDERWRKLFLAFMASVSDKVGSSK